MPHDARAAHTRKIARECAAAENSGMRRNRKCQCGSNGNAYEMLGVHRDPPQRVTDYLRPLKSKTTGKIDFFPAPENFYVMKSASSSISEAGRGGRHLR